MIKLLLLLLVLAQNYQTGQSYKEPGFSSRSSDGPKTKLVIPWDTFKVTWGPPNTPNTFVPMPRLQKDALEQGFKLITNKCDNGKFLGFRMWKNADPAVILLFDKNGIIAGIQSGIPKENATAIKDHYTFSNKTSYQEDTIENQTLYVGTVYFIEPANICSKGRTKEQLKDGTIEGVYFQNGSNPSTNSLKQNIKQGDMKQTKWTLELCYETMGLHYYYNMRKNMSCNDIFNFFLIFNRQQLTEFGILHVGKYESPHFEHLPVEHVKDFLKPVPDCIHDLYEKVGGITTMHVFFNTDPENLKC